MDTTVRKSLEFWLELASPQEIQDLMDILLQELGKRSMHLSEPAHR
jgi:hypothetical protein